MYIQHNVPQPLLCSGGCSVFCLLLLSNPCPPARATLPRDLLDCGVRCHDVSALLINDCLERVPSLQCVLLITAQILSSWLSTIPVPRNPPSDFFFLLVNYCKTKTCIFSIPTAWPQNNFEKETRWVIKITWQFFLSLIILIFLQLNFPPRWHLRAPGCSQRCLLVSFLCRFGFSLNKLP